MQKINNIKSFRRELNYYAYIRFFHALPADPPVRVDIYVNGNLVAENLGYQDFTSYLTAYPGSYQIQVFPAGTKKDQLLDVRIVLRQNEIYTAAIVGTPEDVGLEVIDDVVRADKTTYAHMRFSNLSPTAGGADIYIDGTLVVKALEYLEITNYLSLAPGKHTMKVVLTDTGKTVVSHPNMQLTSGNYYTTYVVGLNNGRPGIEVVIPLEGTSYLYAKTI